MQRGCFLLALSLRNRLPRCSYLSISRERCPLWRVSMCTTIQHRKCWTRNPSKVVYDPKPDMSEEEVKHIKLEPVLEIGEQFRAQKYALLLSFNGQGYYGMQKNMTCNTIENCLMQAMLDIGFITKEQFLVPQLFSYQRSSRTDKGVSAARLLVSCVFSCDESEIKAKLNQHLTDQIRVMAVFKTIKTFNCKAWCDARTYSYTCPTFAFASYMEVVQDSYRLPDDALEEIRRLFAEYIGVRNFHNFTSGIKPRDPRAMRRILNVECGEPFEQDGLQWITIKIKGISFLLHQIRKMIGLVIAIRQGLARADIIPEALSQDFTFLHIAPGLGLVLEDQHFDNYNKKFASKNNSREPLSWDSEAEIIEEFQQKNILTPIMKTEVEERSMLNWLKSLHGYSSDRDFTMIKESEKHLLDRRDESRRMPLLVSLAQLTQPQEADDSMADASHLVEESEKCVASRLYHHAGNIQTSQQPSNASPMLSLKSVVGKS